jgi:hypothetical protein
VLAVAAIVVPLLVLAGSGQATLTAETYADVIRFGVQGAGTLQIQIYDLSEKVLWDSGEISGDFIDWDRTDTSGERLANGYYLYLAQAWDTSGSLILSKTGKVALLPGDNVQLQQAPAVTPPVSTSSPIVGDTPSPQPKAYGDTAYYSYVDLGGVAYPQYFMQSTMSGAQKWSFFGSDTGFYIRNVTNGVNTVKVMNNAPSSSLVIVGPSGNIGVGTSVAPAKMTVEATTGDLIAAYNSSSRVAGAAVFVVKNNGEVRADGAVYAASFNTGSADVAERINTSEWVEAGDVVEIDPDHTGFFR